MFKKETTLPVIVTVMCALLLAMVLLYGFNTGRFDFLKNENQKQVAVQTKEEKIKRTDYINVARKTLDWIDKQRNETGWYIMGKTCGPKDCEQIMDDKEVGNKDGLIATWVRLNFYEQHQDLKDLEIVKKDIDLFYQKHKDKDLNDSLWFCKVTYEMAQSKYIDQGQKDKLKELCFNTRELDGEDLINYWPDRFKREIKVKFPPPPTWEYYSLYERYFDSFFEQITNLAYKYAWSGEEKYKELIEKHFLVQEDLVLNKKTIDSQSLCLFGLSTLDTWKLIDKSKTKLNYVINFYKTIEVRNEKENFLVNPICGIFLKNLYEATNDKSYLEKLDVNNKKIIDNNNREEKGDIDEGFVRSDLSKGGFNPDRQVTENVLVLQSLL